MDVDDFVNGVWVGIKILVCVLVVLIVILIIEKNNPKRPRDFS